MIDSFKFIQEVQNDLCLGEHKGTQADNHSPMCGEELEEVEEGIAYAVRRLIREVARTYKAVPSTAAGF